MLGGLLGIFLGTLCFFFYKNSQALIQTGVKTTATIKEIQKEEVRETNLDGYLETRIIYTTFVTFKTEDGAVLTQKLGYYESSMKEGDSVEIFYNPDNPSEITVSKASKLFLLFGGIFAAVGLLLFMPGLIMVIRRMSW